MCAKFQSPMNVLGRQKYFLIFYLCDNVTFQVNNSINLSSSTEKLNMSSTPPSPSVLLSSPSNMFRPIKNSPISDNFFSASPEKDISIRPRSGTGKQCTRPSSRKRYFLREFFLLFCPQLIFFKRGQSFPMPL